MLNRTVGIAFLFSLASALPCPISHASTDRAGPKPKVLIEEVRADGTRVDFASVSKLKPGMRELDFVFGPPSSPAPGKVGFRYLLKGFDSGFRYQLGTRGEEHYTNLRPGSYAFQVWVDDGSGAWAEPPAEYSFFLEPHFYQTWWFYALCTLLLVLLNAAAYRVGTRVHRRHLLNLVDERTRQLADANALLQRLSNLDGLTGIANRRHFEESVTIEWARARRMAAPLALIMVDIDYFKDFNDAYGHQRGDDCLKQVASVLQSSLHRAGDLVARYGGEEFVAVLPNTPSGKAYRIAEMLRSRIDELNILHEKSPHRHITISLGVASCVPVENLTPMDLVALSDRALYRAKRGGRNRTIQADIPILPFADFETTRAGT